MNHTASAQVRDAASDSRINRKFRTFLHELNKYRTPFCELRQHLPQDRVTGLQNKALVGISGVSTTEWTIRREGRTVYNMARAPPGARANPLAQCHAQSARCSTAM